MTMFAFEPEITTADERYVDYCLWDYIPVAAPVGKWRSVNLLRDSFAYAEMGAPAFALVEAIRQAFGPSRTVWGVKFEGGRLSWELYFYDYDRQQRTRSVTRLLDVIRPWMASTLQVNEARDYFMFSIDLDRTVLEQGRPLELLQLYIGNVGSTVSSGICYDVKAQAMTLKNFYFFFDARTQVRQIIDKVRSSAYLDLSRFELDRVLWPELRECQTIVLANKRHHDGVYFSRITIDQLLFFLRRLDYPAALVATIAQQRAQLDHLLYDVGFDYRMEDGVLRILKSAYYGVF
ncbi:hypothetical protein QN362_07450 [Actimicrobium sp. CCC2.4]|uniref:hypothetical protein n=1 Tax=Actimicrobium sp. CCC2.4 TaxID=3048606 RepID=UPI002AC8A36D|nr:hypothetical protein [Actimicrobium sp. CCC2.4]MEB0135163.1 hypothetical protein [Actimicrobium sp. CCC2.4]WPX30961.1 hypothetical protein RHM62_11905 [Actimicrobium sp. CCC2.4]